MSGSANRVLIVDDDPEITSALARGLAAQGYETVTAHRVDAAMERLRDGDLSAAIVDVMIGTDSGIDLVRNVRAEGLRTPILMLSALSDVEDRAAGLEAGADDYIVKPFSFDELVARLKVQERRARPGISAAVLDRARWTIAVPGREVQLTEREFALLLILAKSPGNVFSRAQLFDSLWKEEGASSENVVDVYLGYLRRKLAPSDDFGFEIKTLRNKGFQIDGVAPKVV